MSSKKGDPAFVKEDEKLARLGKINLRGHERDQGQPVVVVARNGRRRDGQSGAAQAIAVGMNLLVADDRVDRCSCARTWRDSFKNAPPLRSGSFYRFVWSFPGSRG
jgi:hypothetical protein